MDFNVATETSWFRIDDGVRTHLASPHDTYGKMACGIQDDPDPNVANRKLQALLPVGLEGSPFIRYSPVCEECAAAKGLA